MEIHLTSAEELEGLTLLNSIIRNNQKVIGLFTNATGEKCYSKEWWDVFYLRLIKEFPNLNIIEVLPLDVPSRISYDIPSYFSNDIRKMASLIANVDIFITADCGVMHLSSAAHTPTLGLFKTSRPESYRPYGNGSVAVNTNDCSENECIHVINKMLYSNVSLL